MSNLDKALAAAARGWHVVPTRDKRSLVPWRDGGATTEEEVRRFWREFPSADVGVLTGRRSNLYVVDVDRPEAVEENGLDLSTGVKVPTRREGGFHRYYSSPRDGQQVRNSAEGGLDVRGDGGLAVLWSEVPTDTLQPLPVEIAEWARNRRGSSETGPAAVLGDAIEEGGRESALVSLAGSMRRRGAGEGAILAALREFNAERCRPPVDESDLERIAGSVARYEAAEDPAQYGRIMAALRSNPDDDAGISLVDDKGAPTQFAAAKMIRENTLPGKALWVENSRKWYVYDSGIWHEEGAREVSAMISTGVVRIRSSAQASWVSGVERFVKDRSSVDLSKFDTEPWYLSVANGVVDLRTGKRLEPDPDYMVTRLAPVSYMPGASCPNWLIHLKGLFGSDEKVIWFQKACGMALCGHSTTKNHHFVYLVGDPGAGKGMTMRVISYVLGDYVASLSASDFIEGRERHLQWLMKLRGARIGMVEEVPNRRLNTDRLKTMTGGDPITAHAMRQEDVTWLPTHTLFMTSNHPPRIEGRDIAPLRRRYRPISNGPKQDHGDGWEAKVTSEAEGILAWMVEGCLMWQSENRVLPELPAIMADAEAHLSESDPFAEWAEERLTFDPSNTDKVSKPEFVRSFNNWRAERELPAIQEERDQQDLYGWLEDHGAVRTKQFRMNGKQVRGYSGVIISGAVPLADLVDGHSGARF